MNTDSFKQRQLLFQGGNNPPKPRPSAPLINKDMFEPKSKSNNAQEPSTTHKMRINSNPILKIVNQMENKNKGEDKKNSLKLEEKKDLNISKENKNIIEEIKKQIEKGKININKNEDTKKENELKNNEVKKDNKINEITKKFQKDNKKEKEEKDDLQLKKSNTMKKSIDLSLSKDNKSENRISNIIKDLNLNKEKEKENNNNKKNPKNKDNINQDKEQDKIRGETIYETLYGEKDDQIENIKKDKKARSLSDLEIDNFRDFNEEDYFERKYDKSTIDKGKIFFKYRYLKNKFTQINETIRRLSTVNPNNVPNIFHNTFQNKNNNEKNKTRNSISIDNKFKLSNNIHLSFFIQNPSSQCLNSIDKDSELRHYHSQFLQITEKSILSFNLKKYEESYMYLFSNNIINNLDEFGEFLLVVNGFDKFVIGEFLSGTHKPNDKKEVLNSFIKSIKMDYDEISFLECFRFFMRRLYLPKDANLILEIMNAFSNIYFARSKKNSEFVNIYKNPNNIYLLISTILALNTMFTRKDIKNINIIKKEEFVNMNKDVQENIVISLYEELEKRPFLIDNENYNENIYKRMTTLAREKIASKKGKSNSLLLKSKTFSSKSDTLISKIEEDPNYIINEEDSEEENDTNLELNPDHKTISNIGSRPFTRSSFSLTKNLYSFTTQDQEILTKIQKFNKFVGKGSIHEREFLVYNDFTQLIWGRNVEQNKDKGNLHVLNIADIFDVFNGIEHSENIKKYIQANPKEVKEKNNYITIISNKKEINLKSDSLQTSLLWYKALKSLVLKTKNENMKKNSQALNEINTQFKLQIEELWKDFILPKWNIYGNYILTKLKKKNKIQDKKELNSTPKSMDTIIKDTENDKILEYADFFQFFYMGLPSFCRGTIWRLLIGNACYITEELYEDYLEKVEPENFNEFDIKYHEDINTIFNREYNLNQMIADVIKTKDFFLADLIGLKIDQDKIMAESYNILRIFFLMRSDLVYKKSIIPLIFVFLMVDENEYNAFCNVYNLICNSDIIKFYIGDENYLNKNIVLFSELVKKYLPKIHQHFTNLEIEHELYFIPWMTEIYSSSMSYKLLLRVLDLYLINGEYILFQIGLSILAVQEDDLLDLAISEIFKILKKLSSKQKEELFLKKMKSFDCIKEEFNQWKNEDELGAQKLQLFQAIFNDDK